jgi:hypothetical protein
VSRGGSYYIIKRIGIDGTHSRCCRYHKCVRSDDFLVDEIQSAGVSIVEIVDQPKILYSDFELSASVVRYSVVQ